MFNHPEARKEQIGERFINDSNEKLAAKLVAAEEKIVEGQEDVLAELGSLDSKIASSDEKRDYQNDISKSKYKFGDVFASEGFDRSLLQRIVTINHAHDWYQRGDGLTRTGYDLTNRDQTLRLDFDGREDDDRDNNDDGIFSSVFRYKVAVFEDGVWTVMDGKISMKPLW